MFVLEKKLNQTTLRGFFCLSLVLLFFACAEPAPSIDTYTSSTNDFLTIYFMADNNEALDSDLVPTIKQIGNQIEITVPFGTDITKLLPKIVHNGFTITPDPNLTQDFTNPITYTITAANGKTTKYTIEIKIAKASSNTITDFIFTVANNPTLSTDHIAYVNQKDLTISTALALPQGTSLTNLIPTITHSGTISPNPEIDPAPDFTNSLTNPIAYTVTAANGSPLTYKVTVLIKETHNKTSNNAITSVIFTNANNSVLYTDHIARINQKDLTISTTLPFGTNITKLTPTITHGGTSVSITQNFTNPVTYTITTTNGDILPYVITVTTAAAPSTITDFIFTSANNPTLDIDHITHINHKDHTISTTLPRDIDVANLIPTIVYNGASVSPDPEIDPTPDFTNSLTNPIPYTVTAANGKTLIYKVSISFTAPNTEANIHALAVLLAGQTITGQIINEINNNTINLNLTLPFGASTTTQATILRLDLSPKARANKSADTSATISNNELNFTNNETSIVVTAEDDSSIQTYTIMLNITPADQPVVTTYVGTNVLGQAIKDPILDGGVIISVNNLVDRTYIWTFETLTGQKNAIDGTLTLGKAELTNLNTLSNNTPLSFSISYDTGGNTIPNIVRSDEVNIVYKPYKIHSWQDLQAIHQDLTADYILTKDIIFPDENNDGKGDYNFAPIKGADPSRVETDQFTGSFDGQNYTIFRLFINKNENNVGLFGYVGTSGSIKNIGLTNNFVKGNSDVGGLVGRNNGTITYSHATGNVTSTELFSNNIGGLVGRNNNGTVSGYTTGDVTHSGSLSSNVGGLVGRNNGTVSGYATGDVTHSGSIGNNAGGLVGRNNGTVSGYATGDVKGTSDVGGLVGKNNDTVSGYAAVSGYATGDVTGTGDNVGGLLGNNNGTTSGYATGKVTNDNSTNNSTGGLVGNKYSGTVSGYWDMKSTTRYTSDGGIGISDIANVVYDSTKTNPYSDTKATADTSDDVFIFNNAKFLTYFVPPRQGNKWPKLKTNFIIGTGANAKTITFDFTQPDLP